MALLKINNCKRFVASLRLSFKSFKKIKLRQYKCFTTLFQSWILWKQIKCIKIMKIGFVWSFWITLLVKGWVVRYCIRKSKYLLVVPSLAPNGTVIRTNCINEFPNKLLVHQVRLSTNTSLFMIYPVVINLMSDAKYKGLIYHVRDKKYKIFHMKDESICMVNPEQLWSDASWICHKLKSINVF